MSVFTHLPLGQPIPGSPHSVSCSLPTMRDVRGYEEKDPVITQHLTSGYPRFVVHPFARRLAAHWVATTPALAGHTLWLVTSARMAAGLAAHLGTAAGAQVFARDGLHGGGGLELPEPRAARGARGGLPTPSRSSEDHEHMRP